MYQTNLCYDIHQKIIIFQFVIFKFQKTSTLFYKKMNERKYLNKSEQIKLITLLFITKNGKQLTTQICQQNDRPLNRWLMNDAPFMHSKNFQILLVIDRNHYKKKTNFH